MDMHGVKFQRNKYKPWYRRVFNDVIAGLHFSSLTYDFCREVIALGEFVEASN